MSKQFEFFDSDEIITITEPSTQNTVTYPSDFFKDNAVAPNVHLPKGYLNANELALFGNVEKGYNDRKMSVELVNLFLYRYMMKCCSVRTEEKWSSFGVVFVEGGTSVDITPMNLLTIKEGPSTYTTEGTARLADPSSKEWHAYAAILFAIGRYHDASHPDAKDNCLVALKEVLDIYSSEINIETVSVFFEKHSSVAADVSYRRLSAAFDMFSFKYSKAISEYSKTRRMTTYTRNKNCNAWQVLDVFIESMEQGVDIMEWFWTKGLIKDVKRMYKDGNEVDKVDSYKNWGYYMGIMDVSPYSVKRNPSIALFCHMILLTHDTRWSKNAIMPTGCNTAMLYQNICVLLHAMGTSGGLQQGMKIKGAKPKSIKAAPTSGTHIVGEPATLNGTLWFNHFVDKWNTRVIDIAKKGAKLTLRCCSDIKAREGTINKWVAKKTSEVDETQETPLLWTTESDDGEDDE